MVEQELLINSTTVKGKEYKGIRIKPQPLKGIKGLEDGNHFILTKKYASGLEKQGVAGGKSYTYYVVRAEYMGEEVSFFLSDREHSAFEQAGGEGDRVKITLKKETIMNRTTGIESIIPRLYFEQVND